MAYVAKPSIFHLISIYVKQLHYVVIRKPQFLRLSLIQEEQIFDFNGARHIPSYSIKDLTQNFYDITCQSFSKAV